jgi:hypothetical protein
MARALMLFLGLSLNAVAQDGPPVRIVEGELLEWNIQSGNGDMALRDLDGKKWLCRVAPETYITRRTHRVTHFGVRPGDSLELVADMRRGETSCLALTIYLRPPDMARRFNRLNLIPSPQLGYLDSLWQRGILTFSGVVQSRDEQNLVLLTRSRDAMSFQLRKDTVYANGGREVAAGVLQPFTRVYIRASKLADGKLEAYQVVWGDILTLR